MSRIKKIYNTMWMNLLLQIINFSYKFLVTPFLLHAWGRLKYGEWLTLFSFVSSISLLNFGIAKYYGNNLRKLYIKKNFNEYKKILIESLFLIFCIFIIIGVSLYFIIEIININSFLNIKKWDNIDVKISILLLGLSICGSIFLELVSYFYVSIGKYTIKPLLSAMNLLFQLILIIIFSYFSAGIITISAIIFFTEISLTIVSLIIFLIKYNYLRPYKYYVSIKNITKSVRQSSFFQLITISQFFIIQGSVLIIANKLGASSVSLFVITRTITSGLGRQIVQIVNHSIWPELTALFAEKNYEKLNDFHLIMSKISIILITYFILFIFIFIDNIMFLWLHSYKYLNYNLIGVLLFYLLVIYTWIPSSFILMSNNLVKKMGKLSFFSAILFLLLSYWYLPKIGLTGVVIIMIILDILFMTYPIITTACKSIYGDSKKFFFKMIILIIPALFIFCIFYSVFVQHIRYYNIESKIFIFLSISFILMLYYIKFSLSIIEKKIIVKRLFYFINKIKG